MSQTEVQLIKADAVQTADIANSAVTDAKISGLTSSKLTGALPAISGASLTNLPASGKARNLIVNGAMNIAQRGTSRSATTQGNGKATVDRFALQWNHFGVQATETQGDIGSSDTPYTLGFRKFHRIALASAGTANTNTYIEFKHVVESRDMATSGWNYTSSSSNATIQFWFRCSTNQTFYANILSQGGTVQDYAFSFTASGNNTWTKITHTIPGGSNVVFDNTNGVGLILRIIPFYGTQYTNNKTLNQWANHDNTNYIPDMASTWLTAGASTFDLTGVQLEVGDSATDFEHLSYQDDLRKCQRYYYQQWTGSDAGFYLTQYAGGYRMMEVFHPVAMRATPSASFNLNSGSSTGWTSNEYQYKAYIAAASDLGAAYHTSGTVTFSADL
jgi:hypothetical protein